MRHLLIKNRTEIGNNTLCENMYTCTDNMPARCGESLLAVYSMVETVQAVDSYNTLTRRNMLFCSDHGEKGARF